MHCIEEGRRTIVQKVSRNLPNDEAIELIIHSIISLITYGSFVVERDETSAIVREHSTGLLVPNGGECVQPLQNVEI
jgi:hypothetical protein